MHAAVVSSFDAVPEYGRFENAVPTGPHDLVVDVLASGLHPRVRSQADGSHYTSTDELPLIPGIDGVGRGADGTLRYFILPDTTRGSMAERTVIDARRSIVLPADADPIAIAAAMNPAMASWVALRRRIAFEPGSNVLVLGATGSAGRMAVQVARLLGAGSIVAAGRNASTLAELPHLGATETVLLDVTDDEAAAATARRLGAASADVDVVIDYLWGEPTASAMVAVVSARADRSRLLTWIEIGSVAGVEAPIPSAALRASRLQIVGSGQGSVPTADIVAELPALVDAISAGAFAIHARAVSLADVATAWAAPPVGTERVVFTP